MSRLTYGLRTNHGHKLHVRTTATTARPTYLVHNIKITIITIILISEAHYLRSEITPVLANERTCPNAGIVGMWSHDSTRYGTVRCTARHTRTRPSAMVFSDSLIRLQSSHPLKSSLRRVLRESDHSYPVAQGARAAPSALIWLKKMFS